MKTLRYIFLLISFTLGGFTAQHAFAQEYPEINPDSDYDGGSGDHGFLRRINKNNEDAKVKIYAVQTRIGGKYCDLFRVTSTGTVTIAYPTSNNYPKLNFFQGLSKDAEINARHSNFNIISRNPIRFFPSGEILNPLLELSRSNISMRTALQLIPFNKSTPVLRLYSGVNNDATISGEYPGWFRISGKNGIAFWGNGRVDVDNTPHVFISNNGQMGIGMSGDMIYKLNIAGSILTINQNVETIFGGISGNGDSWIGTKTPQGLHLGTNNSSFFYIDANQNTYIGLSRAETLNIRQELKNKYRLFVSKGILSEDFAIAPKSSWADYVFQCDYNLRSLAQLEEFIIENKHLPNIPSAEKVAQNGYSQHDMNKALLEKIEELTLYTIEQQKTIDKLMGMVQELTK